MKTTGQYEQEAVAISHRLKYLLIWQKSNGTYNIYRKLPDGRITLVKRTSSPQTLASFFRHWEAGIKKNNPAHPRENDTEAATYLAKRFHGRAPDENEFEVLTKPKIPDAMASIGKIFAIEYLAERDGKMYCFRHVFKARSRPQLAVSADGKFVTMLGGAWTFTEDGFVDH